MALHRTSTTRIATRLLLSESHFHLSRSNYELYLYCYVVTTRIVLLSIGPRLDYYIILEIIITTDGLTTWIASLLLGLQLYYLDCNSTTCVVTLLAAL
jgi:hypothetical protein